MQLRRKKSAYTWESGWENAEIPSGLWLILVRVQCSRKKWKFTEQIKNTFSHEITIISVKFERKCVWFKSECSLTLSDGQSRNDDNFLSCRWEVTVVCKYYTLWKYNESALYLITLKCEFYRSKSPLTAIKSLKIYRVAISRRSRSETIFFSSLNMAERIIIILLVALLTVKSSPQ